MSDTWNEKAGLARDAYEKHDLNETVIIHGVSYTILDTVKSSPTGFQATAYQRIDTGNVEIAYRGTEAAWDWFRDDRVDLGMVQSKVNAQLPEAEAFTQRVIVEAKAQELQYHHAIKVTVTGHSLGGTHAEVMSSRYKLPGEAFNSYGAVDLAYGVPEGQPDDAPAFINHVKATDIVSAASRHYGEVHGYATEQDVAALRQGRYLDPADPGHPANPMITGQLGAHFITNFAPKAVDGQSILAPENEARYRQYGEAFEHFRHDVLTSRVALHDALNGERILANTAHLHGQLDDALGVATYRNVVGSMEEISGLSSAQRRADGWADRLRTAGSVANAGGEISAKAVLANDEPFRRGTVAAQHALHVAAVAWHEGSNRMADKTAELAPLDPIAAGVIGFSARAAGAVGQYAADDLAAKVGSAGRIIHGINDLTADGLHQAGQSLQEATHWASEQLHETGRQVQRAADALASTQAHDKVGDALRIVPRLDQPEHPDHPMYQQAWIKVQRLDAARGRTSDQHSVNLTGSLVASAKAAGMGRIDHVTLSEDGSRAFASEQVLGRTFQRHAVVDTAKAVSTPLERSSMEAANQATASPARPSPDQTQLQNQGMTQPISR